MVLLWSQLQVFVAVKNHIGENSIGTRGHVVWFLYLGTHLKGYLLQDGNTVNTKNIIEEASSLPVEARALVVDSLLRSLNQPQSENDKKWSVIAERRLAEMRSGKVGSVPGEQVFEKIWKRFDK